MKDKLKKGLLLSVTAFLFGILSTGIVYRFFPQFLCYSVYDVGEGNLYQKEEIEMQPGMQMSEDFVPRNRYLTGISIGVIREDNNNVLIGRLLDEQGKVLEECQFSLSDFAYEFPFQTWVEPWRQYRLEVLFPEKNQSAVKVVFGPDDTGAEEHVSSSVGGISSDKALVAGFIYGTYSRKLLAFWFMVFCLGGFMIGEAVLCRTKL